MFVLKLWPILLPATVNLRVIKIKILFIFNQLTSTVDKIIQLIALRWMEVFLDMAERTMLRFAANILIAVLPCLAYSGEKDGMYKLYECLLSL